MNCTSWGLLCICPRYCIYEIYNSKLSSTESHADEQDIQFWDVLYLYAFLVVFLVENEKFEAELEIDN